MNKILFSFILLSLLNFSYAQKITQADFRVIKKKEDSLKSLALNIIQGITADDRFAADSGFTKIFVRALKTNNSFYYSFDSLITISQLYPKDSAFKIFTWQLVVNDDIVRQHGAIQMHTTDGSLKLFLLIDNSDIIANAEDTITNNLGWIGAVYYKIIETQSAGKNYYTLLGYDENDSRSNKKIVEVLTFNKNEPTFGGAYFSFPDSSKKLSNRFIMEYKKNAGPRLTYDNDMNIIVYEHTISETGEPQKKFTYIPDGDYDGLQWKNDKWVYVKKLFTQQLQEGQAPVPEPIRDTKGNIDEARLKNNESIDDSQPELKPDQKKAKTKTATAGSKTKLK